MGQTEHQSSKFQRLVDDFADTCRARGIQVSLPVIEHGLRERIDEVAYHTGVDATAALRDYFADSWGAQMAERFCADVEAGEARLASIPDAVIAVGLVGRLVAALGQAQFFAAVNTGPDAATTTHRRPADPDHEPDSGPATSGSHGTTGLAPCFDVHTAADATAGLGLALSDASIGPDVAVAKIEIPGRVLAQTREVLEDLVRRLEPGPGQWRACGCPGPCDEQDIPSQVHDALRDDLEQLDLALDQNPTHGVQGHQYPSGQTSHGDAQVLPFTRPADRH
ncbi:MULTISPECIES: hypothetical protein [unclassified Pseudonocardia]|uniref:hypothetical protein n=1 Tax=unclassified Pseudonocardia TaxID=2619320 RepID=UPI000A4546A3|nr:MULTISPECIES: hypothetical protein [unclassified Pseudonocardia]